jgi:hypothetical protein
MPKAGAYVDKMIVENKKWPCGCSALVTANKKNPDIVTIQRRFCPDHGELDLNLNSTLD